MNRTEIVDAVLRACTEVLGADRSTLDEATSFTDDLDADSLALVEVVMALEEEFDVRIPEDELGDVGTVGAAADVVARHLEAAA